MAAAVLSIHVDERQLAELQALLAGIHDGVPRVLMRSVNRTAITARAMIVREIAAAVGMKASEVKRATRIVPATLSSQTAIVSLWGRRRPVRDMNPTQTEEGVSYQTERGRVLIEHAFLATMPKSEHESVFRRRKTSSSLASLVGEAVGAISSGSGLVDRLPIEEQFGPSILSPFFARRQEIEVDIGQTLQKNLDQQVELLLSRRIAA